MKKVFAVLLVVVGVALALYVSLYLLFVGGIVDMVNGLNAHPFDGMLIGIGALKTFILAELAAVLIFFLFTGLGVLLFGWDRPSLPRVRSNRMR